ncbi:hypothetical protein RUM44_013022 [Polyplax serrata]|uniref:Uncharacterized protein n=1 Tax=Polyplax serrata TaxID=468196 RepID=A0ABR1BCZ2_POLSC
MEDDFLVKEKQKANKLRVALCLWIWEEESENPLLHGDSEKSGLKDAGLRRQLRLRCLVSLSEWPKSFLLWYQQIYSLANGVITEIK